MSHRTLASGLRSRRGIALVMTLAVIFLLTLSVLTAATNATSTLGHVSLQVYEKQAVRVAEAGLSDAITAIRADTGWRGFSPASRTMPGNGDASYQVVIDNNISGGAPITASDGTVVPVGSAYLRSSGRVTRGVNRTVTALAVMGSSTIFRSAVFGDQSVSMTGSAVIDAWNSALGPYVPPTSPTEGAPVGTNSTKRNAISLGGNAYVDGTLTIGPGGDPATVVNGAQNATGGVTVNSTAVPMPSPSPPALPPGPYTSVTRTGGTVNLAPGTYGDLTASGGAQVVLSTGTYVFAAGRTSSGSVTLKGGASIVVPAGVGPVKIYFMGTWDSGGGSLINQTGVASNLVISGTSSATSAKLSGTAEAFFAFYAPNAAITIVGNNSIYGSVVGKSVSIPGNASIHYDTALLKVSDYRVDTNWVLTAIHRG